MARGGAFDLKTSKFVLDGDEAKLALDAIAAGRKVTAVWVNGSVSELLAHRHYERTGDLWLTFSNPSPRPNWGFGKLLHLTVDGQRI
jgi:hypothetical protein